MPKKPENRNKSLIRVSILLLIVYTTYQCIFYTKSSQVLHTVHPSCRTAIPIHSPISNSIALFTLNPSSSYKIHLETPDGTHDFECDEDTYILDAAEEAGVENLPYSCRAGACSSCSGKVIEGAKVDQDEQAYLSDSQVDDGYCLTCVSYPTGDCTIKTNVAEEV